MRGELIAGLGLRRGCPAADIVAVVRLAGAAVGRPVSVLAAPAFKRQEAGLAAAARLLGATLLFMDDPSLHAVQARCITRSSLAERVVGFASVAEAAALSAAGPNAVLVLPRIRNRGATCAIAERA